MGDVHGNISHAMRDNYNEYGVEEYYRKVAATYRNPFYPSVKQIVWSIMSKWLQAEGMPSHVRVLDMAAGSGEVTEALLEWEKSHRQSRSGNTMTPGNSRAFIPPNARRSTAPAALRLPDNFNLDIVATDPYTTSAYTARTQRQCYPLSFADLANGDIPPTATQRSPTWDLVICSFALHLVPSASELFALLYELSSKATWLVVIAPHKKPEVRDDPEDWVSLLTADQRRLGLGSMGHFAVGRSRKARWGSGWGSTVRSGDGARQDTPASVPYNAILA